MIEPNKLWEPDAELALDVSVFDVPVLEMLPSAELSAPWPPFLWPWWDKPEMAALRMLGMASTDMGLSCCELGWMAGTQAARSCRSGPESGESLPR